MGAANTGVGGATVEQQQQVDWSVLVTHHIEKINHWGSIRRQSSVCTAVLPASRPATPTMLHVEFPPIFSPQAVRLGCVERRAPVSDPRRRPSCCRSKVKRFTLGTAEVCLFVSHPVCVATGFRCHKYDQGTEGHHHPVCRTERLQGIKKTMV